MIDWNEIATYVLKSLILASILGGIAYFSKCKRDLNACFRKIRELEKKVK